MHAPAADASSGSQERKAFTLVEVVVSLAVLAMVFGAIITAYIQSGFFIEHSGYSLAAQALSVQSIEQTRACIWDTSIGKNELTNLNLINWNYNAGTRTATGYFTNILDVPRIGNKSVIATNFVTVRMCYLNGSSNPPVQLQMVIVDTVWPSTMNGRIRIFTNRTATLIAPDDRDTSSL